MKFLDLFAGIGGFRLGMERAGHECVGYVEWDKYARKSYEAIHNTEGEFTAHDITTITDDDLRLLGERGIDVICGGFPCQSFSVAGKRGGFSDTRGTMFFEIARIAKQIKPRLLLLENVKGLLSHDKGNTFGTILHTLDELGYDCEWQVLNSKNFGVPQNRERVFIVGHLRGSGGREVFSERTPNDTSAEMQGSKDVKVYDFYNKTIKYDIANTVTEHASRTDRSATNVVEVVGNVNPSGRGMNGQVYDSEGLAPTITTNKGEGNKIVVPVLTPDRAEKRQNGRRFKEDGEPMFTLTAQDKHGVLVGVGHHPFSKKQEFKGYHDDVSPCLIATDYKAPKTAMFKTNEEYRIRKLTPKECWRLQSFPDWAFEKAQAVNSDSQLYKQAGNSVTVNVIYEIAKRL